MGARRQKAVSMREAGNVTIPAASSTYTRGHHDRDRPEGVPARWSCLEELPLSCLPRSIVSALTALSLLLAPLSSLQAAEPLTRADYESCQSGDEAAFAKAIEGITVKALEEGTKAIDYKSAVGIEWRRLGIDEVLDTRVDLAVAEVRDETSWGALMKSLANAEKAQELATAVAERVYQSDAVKSAIESLATGVGKEIGKSIELANIDAAGPALECLRSFLGARYGAAVAATVSANAGQEFGLDSSRGGAEISSEAVLKQSGEGITGAAILLMRRQLANMAGRVGQRLVGSILSRLVSVVAGGVGLVLIAKDIWDLRHGVLPIIATEMKSKETKDKVQEELARSLSEQIGLHIKEIGAKSAERVVEIWREFRRAHVKALEIAERDEGFRQFLDTVKPESYVRLDEITGLLLAKEGEAGVLSRLADGTLNDAVNVLPDTGMTIAREQGSVDEALAWSRLAGDSLAKVVDFEVHRRAKPADFSKSSLDAMFALDDRLAIVRLASIDRAARDTLFDIDRVVLRTLARSLTDSELSTLAGYLTGLEKGPRERVLAAVAAAPGKMQVLASSRVRQAVLASADQGFAVDMMLRSDAPFDAAAALEDFRAVSDGRISPILVWDKHPALVVAAAFALLLILLLMRRLFRPRRPAAPPAQAV